ncbi:MAG: SH3 domain-containing protein [Nitrospinota bacterium]
MLQRELQVLVLSLLIVVLTAPIALGALYYVKLDKGKLRAGPATSYDILWILPKYYPVEHLATYKKWLAVRIASKTVGWIHSDVLGRGEGAVVILDQVNVRAMPDSNSKKLFSLPKNYTVLILEAKGDWLQIKDQDGAVGWIIKRSVWISK